MVEIIRDESGFKPLHAAGTTADREYINQLEDSLRAAWKERDEAKTDAVNEMRLRSEAYQENAVNGLELRYLKSGKPILDKGGNDVVLTLKNPDEKMFCAGRSAIERGDGVVLAYQAMLSAAPAFDAHDSRRDTCRKLWQKYKQALRETEAV